MKWKTHNTTGLIGLHEADGTTYLAAVKSHGDQAKAVSTTSGKGDVAALFNRLDEDVRDWPVVVALPTQAGLHRAIELPAADEAATQKMIALRVESLLPVDDATLRWGWQRDEADPTAWVYLAAGSAITQHTPALPPANAAAGVVSQEMALVAQLLERDPKLSLVLVTGNGEHAAVTILIDGKLHGVEQADLDGSENAQLAALDEALAAASKSPRPARLLVTGPALPLAGALVDRWQMQRVTLSQLAGDSSEGGAIAAGAALAMLNNITPAIAFEHDARMPAEDRRKLRRRLIQSGAWLAVALLALAAVDLRNASMLEQDQIDTVMSPDERAALDRERSLASYVQSLGPTPLAILDEIGQRTKDIQLDDISYDANGEFRLRGKLRSTDTVSELVNALSKMQTLDKVSLVSQRAAENNQVEFEIKAAPNRLFLSGFANVQKEPSPADRQANRGGPAPAGASGGEATP